MAPPSSAGTLDSLLAEAIVLATKLNRGRDQNHFASGARSVLQVLGRRGSQTVPDIARERRTSRQNIQTLVNRLRAAGSVQVSANAAHKRSVLVHLTNEGRTLLRQIEQNEAEFESHILSRIPEEQLESAAKVLQMIRTLLEQQGDPEEKPGSAKPTRASRSKRKIRALTGSEAAQDHAEEEDFPVNLL